MTIATVSDSSYIKFLKPLLTSINVNSPGCSIFCWLINCSVKDSDSLKSINSNVECYHDNCNLSDKRTLLSKDGVLVHEYISTGLEKSLISGGAKWLTSPLMGYCTNIRFKVIHSLLNRNDTVLFLDADTIVRKNISDINFTGDIAVKIVKHQPYDGIHTPKRPLSDPGNIQYQLGAIYSNPTDTSKRFFKTCDDICRKDMSDWDQDIIAFKEAMLVHKVDVNSLPSTYKDEGINTQDVTHAGYHFDTDSHIWCGPGRRKFSNRQYVDEYLKYV